MKSQQKKETLSTANKIINWNYWLHLNVMEWIYKFIIFDIFKLESDKQIVPTVLSILLIKFNAKSLLRSKQESE